MTGMGVEPRYVGRLVQIEHKPEALKNLVSGPVTYEHVGVLESYSTHAGTDHLYLRGRRPAGEEDDGAISMKRGEYQILTTSFAAEVARRGF